MTKIRKKINNDFSLFTNSALHLSYKQLGPDLSPQSSLHFQGFRGSELLST